MSSAHQSQLLSDRPIYTALPGLAAHLPCANFAQLPTPLQSCALPGRHIWVKRDDQTQALYGGNKVRKLEFILAAAQRAGQTRVVTFGATGTHHGLATALYCRELGLACELLLFPQPDSPHVSANRVALQQAGAHCYEHASLAKTVAHFYLHPGRLRRDTLFLFAGGSGVVGTLAFINAALELKQQLVDGGVAHPDRLYVACSSGSTLAGLTLGVALAGLPTQVVGVQVANSHLGPFAACTEDTVLALMQKTLRWLRQRKIRWPVDCPKVHLNPHFLGSGYGESTTQGAQAARVFCNALGVPVDETYTAKTCAAVLADEQPGSVLYWHTLSASMPPTGKN